MKNIVIISYWAGRTIKPLLCLLRQIDEIKAGYDFDLAVVCNADNALNTNFCLNLSDKEIKCFIRENIAYNIGAWDYGWRNLSDYDNYLFLQDDCFIVRENWLKAFVDKFYASQNLGLLGESINWKTTWEEVINNKFNVVRNDHSFNSNPMPRVDFYRKFLEIHQIDEGVTAEHIQSLMLFTSRPILEKIDGFIVGKTYGEAIASEIAISKKVMALGYSIETVQANSNFHYIAHPQWVRRRNRIEKWSYLIRSRLKPIFASPNLKFSSPPDTPISDTPIIKEGE